MKESAYLIGPFLGSLHWEYMYFAPYIINLMKKESDRKFIIFTRKSRFDLYGSYADIFVPLRIVHDQDHLRDRFTLKGFRQDEFNALMRAFINKYKKRYKIIDKVFPDISYFSYKVKWQFPKSKMDYDFQPRVKNKEITDRLITDHNVFVDVVDSPVQSNDYKLKFAFDYIAQVTNLVDDVKSSTLGCFIEALKKVEFVIGNLKNDTSKLALLLKKPLITLNEEMTDDEISLINPFKTPVIKCDDVEEGIKIYENCFRPKECGIRK